MTMPCFFYSSITPLEGLRDALQVLIVQPGLGLYHGTVPDRTFGIRSAALCAGMTGNNAECCD